MVKFELNYYQKVILCSGDTAATYKLSGISLEYDTIFDKRYATSIDELYARTTPTAHTKITSIHYQTLSQQDTTWKIDVSNVPVALLQGLLLLFLDKHDDFANKNEEFYNTTIKKVLTTIHDVPYQPFTAGLQARDI